MTVSRRGFLALCGLAGVCAASITGPFGIGFISTSNGADCGYVGKSSVTPSRTIA
ncbi:twin-arginine translocation signal domain-containing protein [Rhodocyclaceae bacterium Wk13]|uniref:Twin-arginine translocation signal domain-containing protein n=1 Tax=Dentiradicibacter hellwigii TaxID=3149053 RepID=A0ABV4UGM6_9RHOO